MGLAAPSSEWIGIVSDIEQRLRDADGHDDDLDAKRWRANVARALFGKESAEVRIGRHRILEKIGAGASGVVYLALDPELDRRVAVKVLRSEALSLGQDPEAWLAREAKTLAKLSHPNVVPVYDVGKHEGKVFITLEYVEGMSLRQWLSQAHSIEEIVDVLGQAARGLAAAHGAGVVHRDFKPENVLLGDDGRVRVSDFGIARRLDRTQHESTLPEGVDAVPPHAGETTTYRAAGTPAYMAPEQFLGDPIDARTDQFSFCVVLHEALYGRRPFLGGDRAALAANVIAGRRVIPPGVDLPPRWLERVAARGLSIKPEDRYASMEALVADLARDRRRRLWPTLGAAGLGVAVTAAVLLASSPGEMPDACAGGREKIDQVWNEQRSAEIRDAFGSTELPYADDSWERIDKEMHRYADAWALAHDQACDDDPDQDVVVERLYCLQSRMLELGSLADVYSRADSQVVDHAVRAVGSLRPAAECLLVDDAAHASDAVDSEAEKADVRLAVAQAKARGDLGSLREGLAQAWSAARRAQNVGDRALEAEALLVAGMCERQLMAEPQPPSPDTTTYAAVLAAEAARRPDLLAVAHVEYVASLVAVGQYERAFEWEPKARAAIEAMGDPAELVGHVQLSLALALDALEERERAREATLRAVAVLDNGESSTRKWLIQGVNMLGEFEFYAKRYDDALRQYQRSLALAVEQLGPRHVWAAAGHGNMGEVFFVTGDYPRALTHFEAALSIRREAFTNGTIWVPHSLAHVGDTQLLLGNSDAAIAAYGEGLRMRERAEFGDAGRNGARPAVFEDLQAELQSCWLRRGLAFAKLEQGELDEAMELARSVESVPMAGDRQHADLIGRIDIVGQILLAQGKPREAVTELESAVQRIEAHYGADHRFLAEPLTVLGRARIAIGDEDAAARDLRRALAIFGATPNATLRSRADAELALAGVLTDRDLARAMASAAVDHYTAAPNTRPEQLAAARALAQE
jgi:tetratricopeptide (TPR) repeat protein/predicted Ser/Thr protein kinase